MTATRHNTLWRLLLAVMAVALGLQAEAAVYRVKGQVTDSVTHQGVPYAYISVAGGGGRVLADDGGHFVITSMNPIPAIEAGAMGYASRIIDVSNRRGSNLRIELSPTGVALGEVLARPKKEHYTKKGNPAVEFVKRLRERAPLTDPRRNPYYNFDRYERITLALNNMQPDDKIFQGLPELRQYVDTSDISGNPILNISVKEKVSDVHFRKNPQAEKVYVTGLFRRGVDEVFDQQSIQILLEDVLREIDVFGGDVTILQNRFVSPLSKIAPDFYKFYLSDTVVVDGEECAVLSFVPRTRESFGFTGRFYVPLADTTMFVKKVELGVPHDINLNFIDRLRVSQEYDRAPDGSRLKTKDDMTLELSVLGQGFYMRRNTAYSGHNFVEVDDTMFRGGRREEEVPGAAEQTSDFWDEKRLIPIPEQERNIGEMMTGLRRNKFYYWGEKIIKILGTGYVGTGRHGNPSKIDIGPVNTMISGNTLEGVRLKGGIITTASLSKRLFGRAYLAYGTRDHRWIYLLEGEYSFRDKKLHKNEFPIHSIAVTSMFDVDMLGQHYQFTNPDNFVLSLKRCPDTQITYHYVNKLTYTLELFNNFSIKATLANERQVATQYMKFINGYGDVFPHFDETSLTVELRYAPGEKFFQTRSQRLPVNLDAPVFVLSHTIAPRGWLGSMFTLNKTELSFLKRFWFSAFGYTDMILRCGHVWSRTPYPFLLIPNANLSYTIQPESFALLNAMEFINDTYASWDLTYWANGLLFNRIPYFKRMKLREVVGFRGIFGHLSDRNNPLCCNELFNFPAIAHTRPMTSTPYMELSVGLDNLFRVLRVDYVWRLTYRGYPDVAHGGLRVALHLTF